MSEDALISSREGGLYCAAGDFYIDACQPVARTVITHAHSDHACAGAGRYLTAAAGERILRRRIGADAAIDSLKYGEQVDLNGVKVSLHPAGHVLGSAQVRVEYRGEVWVVTGDYKRQADATCAPFEVVTCHTLVTECTFGLPIFRWRKTEELAAEINQWWRGNVAAGRTSVLLAYALGKAQRVLSLLDPSIGPILLHGAVQSMVEVYRASGVRLPAAEHANAETARAGKGRALVIGPPGASALWMRKFNPLSVGIASGWMAVRGIRRRRSADMGVALSDHADWPDLMRTISETGAQRVIATHGYTAQFARYLAETGLDASVYATRFSDAGEEDETSAEEV